MFLLKGLDLLDRLTHKHALNPPILILITVPFIESTTKQGPIKWS